MQRQEEPPRYDRRLPGGDVNSRPRPVAGLIDSAGPAGVRHQFALIAMGQAAGLSLDEFQSMLTPSGGPNIDRQLLSSKADDIDATIKQLRAVSRGLRHAAACPAPSHAEYPTFQGLLKAAASGALDQQKVGSKVGGGGVGS